MAKKTLFGEVRFVNDNTYDGVIVTKEDGIFAFSWKNSACQFELGMTEPQFFVERRPAPFKKGEEVVFVQNVSMNDRVYGLPLVLHVGPKKHYDRFADEIASWPYYGIFRNEASTAPALEGNVRQLQAMSKSKIPEGIWKERSFRGEVEVWTPCSNPLIPKAEIKATTDLLAPKKIVRPEEIIVISVKTNMTTNEVLEPSEDFRGTREAFLKDYPKKDSLKSKFVGKKPEFLVEYTVKVSHNGAEPVEVEDPSVFYGAAKAPVQELATA